MEDPIQHRLRVVNHEAGHAVAMWLLDVPIREICCDRPDDGFDGWTLADLKGMIPAAVPPEHQGDTAAMLGWHDAEMSRVRRVAATYLRAGSYFARDDWDSPSCAPDRALVTGLRPPWVSSEDGWQTLVEYMCRDLEDDPRCAPAYRALAHYLSSHFHDVVPGDIAAEVMAAGVLEQAVTDREFAEITASMTE